MKNTLLYIFTIAISSANVFATYQQTEKEYIDSLKHMLKNSEENTIKQKKEIETLTQENLKNKDNHKKQMENLQKYSHQQRDQINQMEATIAEAESREHKLHDTIEALKHANGKYKKGAIITSAALGIGSIGLATKIEVEKK